MLKKQRNSRQCDSLCTVGASDREITLLAHLFNAFVGLYDEGGFKYLLKVTPPIRDKFWYADLVMAWQAIQAIEAIPREFIQAQFFEFKRYSQYSRLIPTPKSLSSPAAVEKWKLYRIRTGKDLPKADEVSLDSLKKYCDKRLELIMRNNGFQTPEEVFRNPLFVSQFSRDYLKDNSIFKELVTERYFEQSFGISASAFIS